MTTEPYMPMICTITMRKWAFLLVIYISVEKSWLESLMTKVFWKKSVMIYNIQETALSSHIFWLIENTKK